MFRRSTIVGSGQPLQPARAGRCPGGLPAGLLPARCILLGHGGCCCLLPRPQEGVHLLVVLLKASALRKVQNTFSCFQHVFVGLSCGLVSCLCTSVQGFHLMYCCTVFLYRLSLVCPWWVCALWSQECCEDSSGEVMTNSSKPHHLIIGLSAAVVLVCC